MNSNFPCRAVLQEPTDLAPADCTFGQLVDAVSAHFDDTEGLNRYMVGQSIIGLLLDARLSFKGYFVRDYAFSDAVEFPEGMEPARNARYVYIFDVADLGPFFVWIHRGRYVGAIPTEESYGNAVDHEAHLTFFDFFKVS